MLYFAFVYLHLLYGIEVYGNTSKNSINRLIILNNKIVRIVQNKPLQYRVLNLYKQDAQLSQRDRAAGCVIVLPKSRRLELGEWETIFYGHYRSIFNHCDIIGLQSYRIRWKKRKGLLRRSRSFKVIEVGINRKPVCDYLLALILRFSPNSIALLANDVTVVEDRLIMSVNIVSQFQSSTFGHN